MPLSIIVPSVSFSNSLGTYRLPHPQGLTGEFIFGVNNASSVTNLAGGPDATFYGVPPYGANYASIYPSYSYFDLNTPAPNGDVTLIQITRGAAGLMNRTPTGDTALGFYDPDASTLGFFGATPTAQAGLPKPSPSSDFYFTAIVSPLGAKAKLYLGDGDALTSATAAVNGGSDYLSVYEVRLGENAGLTGTGPRDIAYCAVLTEALSAGEILETYASLKAYFTARGLTVG